MLISETDQAHLTAVCIGDLRREEFQDAWSALGGLTTLIAVPTPEIALKHLRAGIAADLIVVAQSRPGEFTLAQIESLRRRAPLARVVCLLGSWCEGETRSGKPWHGAVRVYWYDWLPQCTRNLGQLLDHGCPGWGLPVMATEEDRLLAQSGTNPPQRQGVIAIAAPHRETFAALAAGCNAHGYESVWLRLHQRAEARGVVAALWVGGDLNPREADDLRRLAGRLPGVPVVALLDFPRHSTRERARACGAAVVARPFLWDDLFWLVDLARSRQTGLRAAA